jgi:hypothetical protein
MVINASSVSPHEAADIILKKVAGHFFSGLRSAARALRAHLLTEKSFFRRTRRRKKRIGMVSRRARRKLCEAFLQAANH